jgi:hypothetical protein
VIEAGGQDGARHDEEEGDDCEDAVALDERCIARHVAEAVPHACHM